MKNLKNILFVSLFLASPFAEAQTRYSNPVYNIDFADPSVQRAPDGTFYAYATGCAVAKSSDLVHWTNINNVFSRPTWNDSTYVKDGKTQTDYYSLWASDVNYVDGKYVMYYASALWGNGSRTGIGVATATSPTRFTDVGRMFRSTEIKVENSIDPCYIEEGDKKYLAWGSFNGIYIAELTDDGLAVKDFSKVTKIAGTAFEGALIHKRGNYYYLFASTGSCCEGVRSTYETVVGRSKNLMGPYTNKLGQLMTSNSRTVIIKKNQKWIGPGHNSEIITDDEGQDWIMYHAYNAQTPDVGRVLMLDRLKWDAMGWPTIEGESPSTGEVDAPVFYNGNGRNMNYKLQNADFMKSGFRSWTVRNEGTSVFESGVGSVFSPLMHVKGGSFSVQQGMTGLTDAIYEVRMQGLSTGAGVAMVAGSVITPIEASSEIPESADEVSKDFLSAKHTQRAFGLAYSGKLSIGLMGTNLDPSTECWAGQVQVIRRDGDEEALSSVSAWYESRARLALQDASANSYYLGKLESYLTELTAADSYSKCFAAVTNLHKTLSSMNALAPDYNPATDAIVAPQAPSAPSSRYDTLGRPIDEYAQGIVIKDGRKVTRK